MVLNTCVQAAKCHLWSVIQSYIEAPDCRYLYMSKGPQSTSEGVAGGQLGYVCRYLVS